MEDMRILVWIVCFASALIMIGLGIPMAVRKVKRNYLYGARMKYTLVDDDIWYEVNAQAGKGVVIIGVLEVLMGAASFFILKPGAETMHIVYFLIAATAVEMIGLVVITVRALRLSKEMARAKGLE